MESVEELAIEISKNAYHRYFLDKDSNYILENSLSNDDIPLYGLVKPNWEGEYAIISEYARVQKIADNVFIVSARVSLKDITEPQSNAETLINASFVCKYTDEKMKFAGVHMSKEEGYTFSDVDSPIKDSDYRRVLKYVYDVVFEYDSLNNSFSYDPIKYRELFQVDTHFVSMDQWFWNVCTECVHAEDVDLMDIFRSNDIGKRIMNGDYVVENDIRIRNKEKGFIWVRMVVVLFPNVAKNNISKIFVMFKNIDEQKRMEIDYAEKSRKDAKTGFHNKTYFRNLVAEELKKDEKYALAIVDIDNYRLIGDTFGNISAGNIIMRVSSCIAGCVDSEDIIGRIGRDEFGILLKNAEDKDKVEEKIKNIINSVRYSHSESGKEMDITCSAGVIFIEYNSMSWTDIIEKADKMLFEAKESGKNTYRM